MLALKINPHLLECGADEAGRGCLAGPVTAAAVILPEGFSHPFLTDSKQLPAEKRAELRILIEREAVCFHVVHVMMDEIDRINILQASVTAMHRAIAALSQPPQFLAIDGNYFRPYAQIPHQCIVKGDSNYLHIAAASILAKTHRDEYMRSIHSEFPQYNWKQNKGYPTLEHRAAIREFGATPYHRQSFRLLPDEMDLVEMEG